MRRDLRSGTSCEVLGALFLLGREVCGEDLSMTSKPISDKNLLFLSILVFRRVS